MKIPDHAKKIIEKLEAAGFEGYVVGGCVRDTLLSKCPDDWDITTSARPKELKKIFPHSIDTGIAHGTITVLFGKEGYEVTTYRIDGEYEDSRHPREVTFTGSLLEDLKRRDFTINAMAYNDKSGIIDEFEGMKDLSDGVIRCVGDPRERFKEDALRIMRAVRFSAQLGYQIEPATREAVIEAAGNLSKISKERICTELSKLLLSDRPQDLQTAYELGITKVILPEFDRIMECGQNNPHHCFSVGEHTLHALQNVPADKVLRFTMLFHDFGKALTHSTDENGIDHFYGHAEKSAAISHEIMKRLRFDNATLRAVEKLVACHDRKIEQTPAGVRRVAAFMGEELFLKLLQVKEADFMAQSTYQREDKKNRLDYVRNEYQRILERGDCTCIKMLAVTGNDLILEGMEPGAEIGRTLQHFLDIVLEHPDYNTKEYLLGQIQ